MLECCTGSLVTMWARSLDEFCGGKAVNHKGIALHYIGISACDAARDPSLYQLNYLGNEFCVGDADLAQKLC